MGFSAMTESLIRNIERKALPVVYRLGPNLYGACFWLMKLCVGMQMIKEALRTGRIGRGGLVIESTSGTMGYGLAVAARAHGIAVRLVGDPAIDPHLKNLLELLGVVVDIVGEKLPVGGYQVPRLRRVQSLLGVNPEAYWVQQYDNPANPRAYVAPARTIAEEVGCVDMLVATTGSGGSISGTVQTLRREGHPARAVAVDTHRSVLFGQEDGTRLLRGLGNSIMPSNLDHELVDEVHWVEAADAFCATRELFTDHGLDVGPTTGAAFMVARYIAASNPGKTVVFLGPDRAERYLDSVFSPAWCLSKGAWTESLPEGPYDVAHPRDASGGWARIHWNRRSLESFGLDVRKGVVL
jgi:cysteine synthase A